MFGPKNREKVIKRNICKTADGKNFPPKKLKTVN